MSYSKKIGTILAEQILQLVAEDDGFSLAAAKATRQAYKTNKPEDHRAAMNAHLKARGSEFEPHPGYGAGRTSHLQDRWRHHDKQAKMHKAELK